MIDDRPVNIEDRTEVFQKEQNVQKRTQLQNSPNLPIEILYSDEDVIVVNRPYNLSSVPGHAATSMTATEKDGRSDRRKDKKRRLNSEDDLSDNDGSSSFKCSRCRRKENKKNGSIKKHG